MSLSIRQTDRSALATKGKRLVACLLFGLLSASTQASSLDIREVLANTAVTPPARVGFREERHNVLFKEPFLLTGYLEYLAAGKLRKVIETPFEESFLIDIDTIVIERDGATRTLPLRKSRSLMTVLGAIESLLAGDSEKLESAFALQVAGDSESWSIQLTPTSRRIARRLAGLQVDGDALSVTSIRIDLADGEWHLMEILRDEPEP